ncbi:MAG: DUF4198 domain-containing protein [Acidobacteria bacterium]|nr:DUF4198 domain-containing protein [Acidobacteriota bacterium]MCA1619935.1 DUF4198 domain-containing protein [Acidobacteriota bacterium]
MRQRNFRLVGLLAVLALAGSAFAHDLWLIPSRFSVAPGAKVSVSLNTGDTFPASEGAVKPERVERASVVTAAGSTPIKSFHAEGKSTVADFVAPREGGGVVVEVVLAPVATKQPRAGFDEFVRHEGLDQVAAALAHEPTRRAEERRTYAKYAKSFLRVGRGGGAAGLFSRPLGHRLEIVSESDPYDLKRGQALPVRLLFDGRPLANARLVVGSTDAATATQSNMAGVRTDGDGRALLRTVRPGGAHYVHALHMIPASGRPDVEWESFWATLTFGAAR